MSTLLRPTTRRTISALTASLTTAVVLFGTALPASAAGASGTVESRGTVDGVDVEIDEKNLSTSLIPIRLDGGGRVLTYCIDFTTSVKHAARMVEDDWRNYPNPATSFEAQPAKVNWILNNSYPHVELDELKDASGIEDLDKREAIAGTQLAIWHFTNDTTPGERNDDDVLALYAYLTGDKNTGLTAEPAPTLTLTPDAVRGKAGNKLGPFTVRTTAESVKLGFRASGGARLTDASGAPVSKATNGTKLYVTVPAGAAAGKARIEATVSATVKTGRLFRGDRVTTQTLITASNSQVAVDARTEATWTSGGQPKPPAPPAPEPSPSPSGSPEPSTSPSPSESPAPPSNGGDEGSGGGGLPVTGFQTGLIAAIGALLVGGGAALFFFTRRRKTA
jgi:TQXA domain-containing protein/LPXTG-motif cell wall-anchored protein